MKRVTQQQKSNCGVTVELLSQSLVWLLLNFCMNNFTVIIHLNHYSLGNLWHYNLKFNASMEMLFFWQFSIITLHLSFVSNPPITSVSFVMNLFRYLVKHLQSFSHSVSYLGQLELHVWVNNPHSYSHSCYLLSNN